MTWTLWVNVAPKKAVRKTGKQTERVKTGEKLDQPDQNVVKKMGACCDTEAAQQKQ
jgi:hypothetical protein